MSLPVAESRSLEETLANVPESRRAIREDLKRMIRSDRGGRGSTTRGWRAAAPQRGKERRQLMEECGEACFLLPDRENPGQSKFPVCPALREKQGCVFSCKGAEAAERRAAQYGHVEVKNLAAELKKQKCGSR